MLVYPPRRTEFAIFACRAGRLNGSGMFRASYVEGAPPRWTPIQTGGVALIGDGQMAATREG
jgi:hypothetical protein